LAFGVSKEASNGLFLSTERGAMSRAITLPYDVVSLAAGRSSSIVPDRANIEFGWKSGAADSSPLITRFREMRLLVALTGIIDGKLPLVLRRTPTDS
jgi:hypothetical protein